MSAERRELLRRLSEVGIDLSGADDAWVMQPIKPVALGEVVARIRVLDAFAEGPSAVRALSGQPRTMLAPAEVELASRGILARWLGGTPSPRLLFARGRSWPDRRMSRDAASCLRWALGEIERLDPWHRPEAGRSPDHERRLCDEASLRREMLFYEMITARQRDALFRPGAADRCPPADLAWPRFVALRWLCSGKRSSDFQDTDLST